MTSIRIGIGVAASHETRRRRRQSALIFGAGTLDLGSGILKTVLWLLGIWGGLPVDVPGETVNLSPVADTSLFQFAPENNFGAAVFFNAGTAYNGNANRGLIQFDVSSHLPSGALIQSATLVIDVVQEPRDGGEPSAFGLHRVLVSWGEGDKVPSPFSPGIGEPATVGEATWIHRFAFTDQTWAAPGGAPGMDYVADASGSQWIYSVGDSPYTFESTPVLVADVQRWLDQPQANFGWMFISQSEGIGGTARGFGSREAIGPPRLELEFTLVPEPRTCLLLGVAALALLARHRGR